LNFSFFFKWNIDVNGYPLWCYSHIVRLFKSIYDISWELNKVQSYWHIYRHILYRKSLKFGFCFSLCFKTKDEWWSFMFSGAFLHLSCIGDSTNKCLSHYFSCHFIFFIESQNFRMGKDLRHHKVFILWLTKLNFNDIKLQAVVHLL
jgi:hypothetical protein